MQKQEEYTKRISEASAMFFRNKASANSQIPRIAEGMPGAQQAYDTAKQELINAVSSASAINNELNQQIGIINAKILEKKQLIDQSKLEVKETSELVKQERTLNIIRKEQAESLQQKYEGNYHSSWMGLYRPLREESRYIFLVIATLFFVVVLCILVYAFQKGLLIKLIQHVQVPEFGKIGVFE